MGGGPVGVALAIDLAGRGVSCAVVERRTGLSRIPKGQDLTQRTMEHFRSRGLAEQLRGARTMPPGHPIGTVVAYGDLMSEFWGGEGLLDSYSAERQGVFTDIGQNIIAAQIERDRDWLERWRPEDDRAAFEAAFAEIASSGAELAVRDYEPHYEGSAIVAGPPGAVISAQGEHTFRARPGHHLAPLPLSAGRNALDAVGPGYTLLALDAPDGAAAALTAAAGEIGMQLAVVADSRTDGRERYGARLVLVRPDQHVAWAGDATPADPAALVRTLAGRD